MALSWERGCAGARARNQGDVRGGPVGPGAAGMATPAPLTTPRSTELRLTVWVDAGAAWHARAEWGPSGQPEQRAFDSPLELARFMAQLPHPNRTPPGQGGLR